MRLTTATFMALFGALTGIVSAIIPDSLANVLQPVSSLFFLKDSSVHPAIIYGPVVSLGFWWAGERRAWVLVFVFVVTALAWSAAVNSALWIYEFKDHRTLFGEDVATPASGDVTLVIKLLTGLVAGIVGATFMVAGSALAVPALRGVAPMLTTGLVGGLAGLLLYFFLSGWHETLALLIILPVWQASVGFCIGHWLGLS